MRQPSGGQPGGLASASCLRGTQPVGWREVTVSLRGADSVLIPLVAACSVSRQRLLFLAQDS